MKLKPVLLSVLISVMLVSCGDLLETGLDAFDQMRYSAENLAFYYPFDGNTNDAGGNDYDGLIGSEPGGGVFYTFTTDRFGNSGAVISNIDDTSYVDSTWGLDFNLSNAFSVNLWVFYPNFVVEPSLRYIFGISELYPPVGTRFFLSKNDDDGELRFVMNSTGLSSDEDSLTFDSLWSDFQDANWHMITIVHKEGTGVDKLSLYVDGIKRSPDSTRNGFSAAQLDGSIYLLAARTLFNTTAIGNTEYTAIDDFRFYTRSIDELEIDALYHKNGFDL